MAVYTTLSNRQLADLIAQYDVGALVSAKGIAQGISNSNWLVETTTGHFVLTMYEKRIEIADLPFFLGLLDHLAMAGCPVPATIHGRDGNALREIDGKAVALIEFLPGVSPDTPSPSQAQAVGAVLADIHLAAQRYAGQRANGLGPSQSLKILSDRGEAALRSIDPGLCAITQCAQEVARIWPRGLPASIVHTDLFPDNVLMLAQKVTGVIDFYFAAHDMMAYDLAVTHAAWCFDTAGRNFDADVSSALIGGYETRRPLEDAERDALPLLAQGACLRFIASRVEDWLDTPPSAGILRKDPMAFARRLDFYREQGAAAFA